LTRHELKAQDEITTKLQNFSETAVERKKEILIGVAAVLVLVLAFFGWRFYANSRNTAAQGQLGAAIAAFNDPSIASEKERYEKTIAEAQKVVDSYDSTPAGAIARYYMAVSQEGLGDSTRAEANLQDVVSRGESGIDPVARFALAGLYKRRSEYQKAIDLLKNLEGSGAYSRSAVAYELAVNYEASGQRDQMQTYYSKIITDYPDSTFREPAEVALKKMGVPIPTPAPPPTPAP
jgi:predicted negative regulator of RcsB-dependent stress response